MIQPKFISEDIAFARSRNSYTSGSIAFPNMFPSGGLQFHHKLFVDCFGTLVDITIDPANCGGCGYQCQTGQTCCDGKCVLSQGNCGGCGTAFACGPAQSCCQLTFPADGTPGVFGCANIGVDANHCTGCNQPCPQYYLPGRIIEHCCFNGRCLTPADLQTNNSNCGRCNNNCPAIYGPGSHCSQGHCCPSCTEWFDGYNGADLGLIGAILGAFLGGSLPALIGKFGGDAAKDALGPGCYSCETINKYTPYHAACCGGPACTDLDTDTYNCGTCGHDCTQYVTNSTCSRGGCTCPSILPNRCLDQCVNLQTGAGGFCGSCGNTCGPNSCCNNGICTSILTDLQNCGSCGNLCAPGFICCNGVCTSSQSKTNCGACGNKCSNGESGQAVESCCGYDGCRDLMNDSAHCGQCRHDCYLDGGFSTGATFCQQGVCIPPPYSGY